MRHPVRTFLQTVGYGFIVVSPICAVLTPAVADQEQGRRLALLYCARCHAIDRVSPSPLKIAPPFRTLHERYPVETLQEALAEGIVTGHPTMPEFSFEPDQVNDFILFLKSLERGKADR
jgi:mono/diheme cytochrome c family protein